MTGKDAVFGMPEAALDVAEPLSVKNGDLLTRARAAWEMGDWAALAGLANQPLETLDERGRLALLAAVGLAQLGQMEEARHYARLARDWGCPTPLMAQVLLGGVLNSLGRAACLLGEDARARGFFEASVDIVSPRADAGILGRARDIAARTALGLLPEAAALMGQALEDMTADQAISAPQAEIFRSQVELINVMLALAQQRRQSAPEQATADKGADLKRRSAAQLGQDLWVLEQTGHKRGGFFVEFGATDGVLLSNTLLLETEFDWRGICAEPNPRFFRKLRANRACTVAPDCIMGRSGQVVDFILADEYGGVADYADYDSHAAKRDAFRKNGEVITLQSISLDDFLKKYDAPKTIDYLSIDTEGSEYEILKAFPFEDWDIGLLTVEHNFTPIREDIRALLEGHGYACIEMQWDDWYFRTLPD